ncbi:MAG: hypothetical protein LM589_02630 [Thermosphaera sp.]|nr:hypothetical protein [Thermosphaera sp.]
MKKYVTISVIKEVKDLLERDKGRRDWSSYLLELYRKVKEAEAESSFNELRKLLSREDLERILESSREFRERFKLR